jgi:integrase/recombinase XerD
MSSLSSISNPTRINDFFDVIKSFEEFCNIDRQLLKSTIVVHRTFVKAFIRNLNKPLEGVTDTDVRDFLSRYKEKSPYTYANALTAMKIFVGDFLKKKNIVESFRFPSIPYKMKKIPSKAELKGFYSKLGTVREKAMFKMFLTTGLRKSELLELKMGDIDFEKRMIRPSKSTRTKTQGLTFYTPEAELGLKRHLSTRKGLTPESKVFDIGRAKLGDTFTRASRDSGIHLTPQMLREWFCSEMLSKGVQEVYVDAFCGRVPRSVLARHYTDFSPERLREIYDRAGLKVLS